MKIGNKSGSNIKPWGAPDITVQVEEWEDHKSTTETYWIEKKEKKRGPLNWCFVFKNNNELI